MCLMRTKWPAPTLSRTSTSTTPPFTRYALGEWISVKLRTKGQVSCIHGMIHIDFRTSETGNMVSTSEDRGSSDGSCTGSMIRVLIAEQNGVFRCRQPNRVWATARHLGVLMCLIEGSCRTSREPTGTERLVCSSEGTNSRASTRCRRSSLLETFD